MQQKKDKISQERKKELQEYAKMSNEQRQAELDNKAPLTKVERAYMLSYGHYIRNPGKYEYDWWPSDLSRRIELEKYARMPKDQQQQEAKAPLSAEERAYVWEYSKKIEEHKKKLQEKKLDLDLEKLALKPGLNDSQDQDQKKTGCDCNGK